jgi:hypothetical protein
LLLNLRPCVKAAAARLLVNFGIFCLHRSFIDRETVIAGVRAGVTFYFSAPLGDVFQIHRKKFLDKRMGRTSPFGQPCPFLSALCQGRPLSTLLNAY